MTGEDRHVEAIRREQERRAMEYITPICRALLGQGGLETLKQRISSLDISDSLPGEQGDGEQTNVEVEKMVEVEDKYFVGDIRAFQLVVESQGFLLVDEITQHDNYSDAGHALRDIDEDTRTRRVYDTEGRFKKGELKWEGPRGVIQDRAVVEVKIPSEADVGIVEETMKDRLGIEPFATLIKHRWHYKKQTEHGVIEIELDSFEDERNSGRIRGQTFAQVAMEVPETRRREAIGIVKRTARELGLLWVDNRDYTEIVSPTPARGRLAS